MYGNLPLSTAMMRGIWCNTWYYCAHSHPHFCPIWRCAHFSSSWLHRFSNLWRKFYMTFIFSFLLLFSGYKWIEGGGRGCMGPILWGEADRGYFHASACLMGQYCAHCTDCLIQIYANAALARNSLSSAEKGGQEIGFAVHRRPFKRGLAMQTPKKGAKSLRAKYQIKGKIFSIVLWYLVLLSQSWVSLSVSEKEVKMSKDVSQLFLVLTFILVGDLRGRQGHKTAKRGIRVKSFVWDTDHV